MEECTPEVSATSAVRYTPFLLARGFIGPRKNRAIKEVTITGERRADGAEDPLGKCLRRGPENIGSLVEDGAINQWSVRFYVRPFIFSI